MTDRNVALADIIRRLNEQIARGDEAIKAINRVLSEMEREDSDDDDDDLPDHGLDERRFARGN